MDIDTLSDVLRAVRLTGAVFFDVEATAPWVAEAPPAEVLAPAVMSNSQHVIEYHVITGGACWASLAGQDAVRVEAGDVVAFPQGDAHVLSSRPGMKGGPDMTPYQSAQNLPILLNLDGGGEERAHIVCGFLGCDSRPFNPLLQALPRILHVRGASVSDSTWRRQFTRFAVLEAAEKRTGGSSILAKLGELMFAEIVRHYVETLPEESKGWFAGLRDRHVGRALRLMHGEPARAWKLETLAREAGLSRSAFAERFSALIGMAPMQYLQRWRLQLAASRLTDGAANVAAVAAEVGYESEAAFSRAFKRLLGVPPAEWRKAR